MKGKLSHSSTSDIFSPEVDFLLKDETGQINNLIGKYIMELLKLKHLQQYMSIFELEYIHFERIPQRHQLTTTFHFTIEEVFETLKTDNV